MTATTGFERDSKGFFIRKDPSAVNDYTIDYTNFLADGETIASQTTSTETGMTINSSAILSGNKKIKLVASSGTAGTNYDVKIVAVTSNSLTHIHRFRVKVEDIYLN